MAWRAAVLHVEPHIDGMVLTIHIQINKLAWARSGLLL